MVSFKIVTLHIIITLKKVLKATVRQYVQAILIFTT